MIEFIKRNLKSLIIYSVLGLVVYLLTLYTLLPYEKMLDKVIKDIERAHDMKLKIGSISPRLPVGIKATGIEIVSRSYTNGKPIKFDYLKIKIPVLGLIFYPFTRTLSFVFNAEEGKSEISGILRNGKKELNLAINASELNLASISPLLESKGVSLSGNAKIKFIFNLPKVDIALLNSLNRKMAADVSKDDIAGVNLLKSNGEIHLKGDNINIQFFPTGDQSEESMSSSSVAMSMLSTLPLAFSKLEVKTVLNKKVLEIRDLSLERQGMSGKLTGVIKLAENFQDSLSDITINLRLAPEETLLRPMLSIYGPTINCPINPDNTVSCKLNGALRDLFSTQSGTEFKFKIIIENS